MAPLTTAPHALAAVLANASKQPTHQTATKKNSSRQGYKIAEPKREAGIKEAIKKMEELGLDLESPKIVITGSDKRSNSVGTDAGQTSTIVRYQQFWRHLLDFCIEIGDYESAGILCRKNVLTKDRDYSPADPIPVKLDTVINFMMMRVLEEGKVLTHHATDLPVLNAQGHQILCMGDWHSTNQVQLYSNALSKVHSKYASTSGEYLSECSECQRLSQSDPKANGCRRHVGNPLVWRRGSPTKDALFTTKLKQMKDYCERNYSTRHAMYFLPSELRQIRSHCLAANNKRKMMIWTIWIVGIKGFLRVEEALSLTVEDFEEKYFVVDKHSVENLAYFVNGKTDHEKCLLACWDDAECPEFSPVRPLLLWLAVSGIRSGPIFPPSDQLDSVATFGTVQMPRGSKKDAPLPSFSYNEFLKETQFLCATVLGKDMDGEAMNKLIIGTHMMRKTAYLLAIWGWKRTYGSDECPLDSSNLFKSARHSSVHSIAVYASDAATMKVLLDSLSLDSASSNQSVGVWKPIHIEHITAFETLKLGKDQYVKPLRELAEWYVVHTLKLSLDSVQSMSYHDLHHRATAIKPDLSLGDELRLLIDANCHPGVALAIKDTIKKMQEAAIAAAVQKATDEVIKNMALHLSSVPADAAAARTCPDNPNKRSREDNAIEPMKDYQQLAKKKRLSKQEAVTLCVEAYQDVKAQVVEGKTWNGTAGFRNWAYRAAKVVDCVRNCHGNCQESFVAANPSFTISRFGCCAAGTTHTGSYGTE